jgi:hypothetical protein
VWKLLKVLVQDLIVYMASRLMCKSQAFNENVCPIVLFMGMPALYKEVITAFGDGYVVTCDGTDNTSCACSVACVALSKILPQRSANVGGIDEELS